MVGRRDSSLTCSSKKMVFIKQYSQERLGAIFGMSEEKKYAFKCARIQIKAQEAATVH